MGEKKHYKQLSICASFEAAAGPLRIAPSTFGLTMKSPQMTDLFFLSKGTSPPLQCSQLEKHFPWKQ
ncbi:hypothetical protein D5086_022520 [Populus alba]|uniref:Uncharacterized protein n=1 Tax=Populus alba TaxID=43335 RepID=A0ACC4BGP8_POPAL